MRISYSQLLLGLCIFMAPLLSQAQNDNTLTKKEKKEGWVLLFDGKSLKGWKGFKDRAAAGWQVENGEIMCKEGNINGRSDLITTDMYENFELSIEWKIAPKHNSGIIYMVTEEAGASYETGPEYQLIDDLGYPDPLRDVQLSGSNYDMHPPLEKVAKPAGEYNITRILINKGHVEHWLNGVKVVEYELWTPEWEQTKTNSKWKDVSTYGQSASGYLALQDHGGGVWFKNIKLRKL
ncbi:MAG: DUF1080 domain-containing protein [Chitinophagaceae bacterium]|nr:DUF1080 domain-containing protein [Chitinophagaceae bacterium]